MPAPPERMPKSPQLDEVIPVSCCPGGGLAVLLALLVGKQFSALEAGGAGSVPMSVIASGTPGGSLLSTTLVLVDTELLGARRAGARLQLGSHLPWEPLLTPLPRLGFQKVMEWSSPVSPLSGGFLGFLSSPLAGRFSLLLPCFVISRALHLQASAPLQVPCCQHLGVCLETFPSYMFLSLLGLCLWAGDFP